MLLRKCLSLMRSSINSNLARIPRVSSLQFSSSSTPPNESPVQVEVSPDGSLIVCWHPEPEFPYEHSKPLPRKQEDIKESDSVLKVQYLLEERAKYRPDGPTVDELDKMFNTGKPYWRPRPRRRYAKPNPPVDRKSI